MEPTRPADYAGDGTGERCGFIPDRVLPTGEPAYEPYTSNSEAWPAGQPVLPVMVSLR
jgi:hypothetical protein